MDPEASTLCEDRIKVLAEGAWCVRGDFNEMLCSTERNGRTIYTAQMHKFNEWVYNFGLIKFHYEMQDSLGPTLEKM